MNEEYRTEQAPRAIAPATADSADILRAAMERGADVATLDRLLGLVERERANQAAAAYNAAVVRFQAECPVIARGDTANGMAYSRMDRIWRTIRPLMEKCGLAVTWEGVEIEGQECRITGHLRHALGHAVALSHRIPIPEANRGTNATQRAGSAETYAKRYALCSALGIQTGQDDDANGVAQTALDDGAKAEIETLLRESRADRPAFFRWAGCESLEDFPAAKYGAAVAALRQKKGGAR